MATADSWKKVPLHSTQLCEGVDTNTMAREWRCKWSEENEKMSLTQCQKVLDNIIVPQLRDVHGLSSVQRVVCGDCQDFKVICKMGLDAFDDWASVNFSPEAEVIEALLAIEGISKIETQTYSIMPVLGAGRH
mmetsp:Transcript_23596/g.59994  ORF Transcript_23596/g.59994 Transcript_23596/m.59994 type:complete len:133 (-) Transcript_23596:127-525(-)